MPRPNRYTLLFAVCLLVGGTARRALTDDQPADSDSNCTHCKCCQRNGWFIAETDSFQACCQDSAKTAELLVQTAELLRRELLTKWLGASAEQPLASWNPKCQIVLHPTLEKYVAACGRGSEHTIGSSLVKLENDQPSSRRIDLLGARSDFLTAALPHELTHVVLKDRFLGMAMPRWADEGAAILADTFDKQGRHRHDLEDALARHRTFDSAALMTLEDYPQPDRVGTFYGQSVSLTEFLVAKASPSQFVNFIALARANGYDAALRQCYHISSVAELDHQWRQQLPSSLNISSGALAVK